MTRLQGFSFAVQEKIGFYVYLLRDPETQQVFYVGKGKGNRVFDHANAAINDPIPAEKLDRIRAIHDKGFTVQYDILRHGLTEKEAFEVEAALIDYLGVENLTNQVQGHGFDDRGLMSASEIMIKYDAQPAVITEPLILITINKLYRRDMSTDELYEATRGDWVIGERRNEVRYALAVYHGVIRQAYKIERWFPVTLEPESHQKRSNRWRFEGVVASELQKYLSQSTVNYVSIGSQNPIRYVNCP